MEEIAGEKIGVIHVCEELLQRYKTQSQRMSLHEQTRLAEELQLQLLNRK